MANWLIVLLVAALGCLAGWALQWAEKRAASRFCASNQWEMLFFHPFPARGRGLREIRYQVRFRDRERNLVEGILAPRFLGGYYLTNERRIPKEVEQGMFNVAVEFDCRKCGTTIPAGVSLCPYCHSPRDVFPFPRQDTLRTT
jgi:hypothetical protein